MTHQPRFDPSETVAHKLDEHQRTLGRDLDEILDVEAGLREVLLQSRHDALVDDLDDVLDVEAGLNSILPAETHPATPRPDASQVQDTGHGTEELLRSVDAQARMRARVHPDVVKACQLLSRAVNLDLDLARALARARDRDLAIARDGALDLDCASDLARALDLARARARALASDLDRARALDRARDRALDRAIALASDLARALDLDLDRASDLARALDLARAQARDLVGLFIDGVRRTMNTALGQDLPTLDRNTVNAFLDDFTTSDLSTADLTGIDLSGVQWTERGTRWPPSMDIEDLKARSEETPQGSGIYVVRSGTATTRDFAGL